MKRVAIISAITIAVAVMLFAGAVWYYTPPQGAFNDWHKTFAAAKEDAMQRNVPILVKVGAEL